AQDRRGLEPARRKRGRKCNQVRDDQRGEADGDDGDHWDVRRRDHIEGVRERRPEGAAGYRTDRYADDEREQHGRGRLPPDRRRDLTPREAQHLEHHELALAPPDGVSEREREREDGTGGETEREYKWRVAGRSRVDDLRRSLHGQNIEPGEADEWLRLAAQPRELVGLRCAWPIPHEDDIGPAIRRGFAEDVPVRSGH